MQLYTSTPLHLRPNNVLFTPLYIYLAALDTFQITNFHFLSSEKHVFPNLVTLVTFKLDFFSYKLED